jgi:hypothetical protein
MVPKVRAVGLGLGHSHTRPDTAPGGCSNDAAESPRSSRQLCKTLAVVMPDSCSMAGLMGIRHQAEEI